MIVNLNTNDVEILKSLNKRGDIRFGLTSGCFDLFHPYHLLYLERCRRFCEMLVVGVDSDTLVRACKGEKRPIYSEHYRSMIVNALSIVDFVFVMNSVEDFGRMAEVLCPQVIFKNEGYPHEKIVGREYAKEIITIPDLQDKLSTSAVLEGIIAANTLSEG